MKNESSELRNALGSFATGVCVVLVPSEKGEPDGMTINSFTSVSLSPPMVLWCINKTSRMCHHFEEQSEYSINVLTAEQQDLSRHYAKSGSASPPSASSHISFADDGTPFLQDSATTFFCRIVAKYDGGDHYILLSSVLDYQIGHADAPLVFHRGRYQSIAA